MIIKPNDKEFFSNQGEINIAFTKRLQRNKWKFYGLSFPKFITKKLFQAVDDVLCRFFTSTSGTKNRS